MAAQVVVLAGPSGSGKSRLAARLALPVLRLDDFYKDAGDPTLPLVADGPRAGSVDWDHPASWLPDEAVAALVELCTTGSTRVPVYDIAHDGRTGHRDLHVGPEGLVLTEGIFAADVVAACRDAGVLAAAFCLRQPPVVTFWRRLTRDLREHRKPPLLLVRRGLSLMRAQRSVVARAVALGCEPVGTHAAHDAVAALRATTADLA